MLDDAPRLGSKVRDELTDPANDLYVSIVSIWEMALKARIGKLQTDIAEVIGYTSRPCCLRTALAANPVIAGLVAAICIECLLTGMASFASSVRVGMAGTSPTMTRVRVGIFGADTNDRHVSRYAVEHMAV
jgi:hypothetical protein